jgi:hypothetical protein
MKYRFPLLQRASLQVLNESIIATVKDIMSLTKAQSMADLRPAGMTLLVIDRIY